MQLGGLNNTFLESFYIEDYENVTLVNLPFYSGCTVTSAILHHIWNVNFELVEI